MNEAIKDYTCRAILIAEKLWARAIVAMMCAPIGVALASDTDPCGAVREAWRADVDNAVLLDKWNRCLANVEPAKQKRLAAERAEATARAKRPGVRIGMTSKQVMNSTHWGRPESINRTVTGRGVREQWVYEGGSYLYFDNGILRVIQTSD